MVKAWVLQDEVVDGTLPNHRDPKVEVSLEELAKIGILYWKMEGPSDPKLQQLCEQRGYSYKDEINLRAMLPKFYEEHLHDDEEIRLCVDGSGYFDVRNFEEQWVRVEVQPGDLIILPAGIYHRFTLDSNQFIHAVRFFIDQPNWTPFNRPSDERPARHAYLTQFVKS